LPHFIAEFPVAILVLHCGVDADEDVGVPSENFSLCLREKACAAGDVVEAPWRVAFKALTEFYLDGMYPSGYTACDGYSQNR
jgi:hypothetical protein